MTLSHEDKAEGICAALARAEAAFDKRGWVEMPKADRDRYVQRAMLAKPLIAQAIREACNEKLEEAARMMDDGPLDTKKFMRGEIAPAEFEEIAERIREFKDTTP